MNTVPALRADVIVVGAGSTGATLASRLSDDRSRSVLLLELGPDWRSATLGTPLRIPATAFAWEVRMSDKTFVLPGVTAQRFADGPVAEYVRGWGLGGCSIVNGCYAPRPPLAEFAGWGEGWGPDDVLDSFRAIENDVEFGDEPYHGRGGPITLSRLPEDLWGSTDEAFRETAVEAGHAWEPDQNAPGREGVTTAITNIALGSRVTVNDAYLEPVRRRENLRIIGGAQVDRVLFEGDRAVGVRVRIDGEVHEARADEIVLSAGAVHSPAILQRSGIGPADLLAGLGIPVVADLPVGRFAQEHPGAGFALRLNKPGKPAANGERGNVTLRFTSPSGGFGYPDFLMTTLNPLDTQSTTGRLLVSPAKVHSTGTLEIVSTDPDDHPRIAENMLSDPRDRQLARELMRACIDLWSSGRMGREVAGVYDDAGSEVPAGLGDAELDAYIRSVFRDTAHLTTTVPLGGGEQAVLDQQARVRGIRGLRVADASIFPAVTAANPHLATIMVGEHVARLMGAGTEAA